MRYMIELTQCDVCGEADRVTVVTLDMAGKTVVVDLCHEHQQPVVWLMGYGQQTPEPDAPKRGRATVRGGHAFEPFDWKPGT